MKESMIFAADVGGTTVKLGLFQADGTLKEKWEIPTRTENKGSGILPDVAAAIRAKMAQLGLTSDQVLGLGIGIPGPIDENHVAIHG